MKDFTVKTILPVLIGLGLGLWLGVLWDARAGLVKQPIDFNHKKHLALDLKCEFCHSGVRETAHAGMPPTKICAQCHNSTRPLPPTPPILGQDIAQGREIDWKQVHRVPQHVLFSHRRHVQLAGLDCAQCHGDVSNKEHAFEKPYFRTSMSTCLKCHRQNDASTDCLACHK